MAEIKVEEKAKETTPPAKEAPKGKETPPVKEVPKAGPKEAVKKEKPKKIVTPLYRNVAGIPLTLGSSYKILPRATVRKSDLVAKDARQGFEDFKKYGSLKEVG